MRQVNLDCEGPVTKNDNALELCQYFIPEGERFFSLISKYDDFLADILRREGHKAGSTLKFILPFLKAYGATNEKVRQYSLHNILLVPGASKVLSLIRAKMPIFIISTSYRPYIEALCKLIDFPVENTYSTSLDLDKYKLPQDEIGRLRELTRQILFLPQINLSGVKKKEDLPPEAQKSIHRLDEIFTGQISGMKCWKMLKEADPLGGEEKVKAIVDSLERTGSKELSEVMYVGDSITDVEALKLVKRKKGIAVSFNGNRYAINSAEVACISPHAFPLLILADIFCDRGRRGVLTTLEQWPAGLDDNLRKQLLTIMPFPRVEIIQEDNRERLIQESEEMRAGTRGVRIGRLG